MLRFEAYSFNYAGADLPALESIDFHIAPGQWLWVTGPEGSGKSTLLSQLQAEASAHGHCQGRILYRGKDLTRWSFEERLQRIAGLSSCRDLDMSLWTAQELIQMTGRLLGWSRQDLQTRLAELAHAFGLDTLLHCPLAELSQGQARRVDLASSFFVRPELIVLDDAFDDLDVFHRRDIWRFIKGLQEDEGLTIISASQDGDLAAYADLVLCLDAGKILFKGEVQTALRLGLSDAQGRLPLPELSRLAARIRPQGVPLPLSVREARTLVEEDLVVGPAKGQEKREGEEELLRLERVRFRYETPQPLLEDVCLNLGRGDRLFLFGANASGKSTLLSLMAGQLEPWEGRIRKKFTETAAWFNGSAASYMRGDDCQELIQRRIRYLPKSAEARARRLGDLLGIFDFQRHPLDLSSGMQQRLALWLVLARPADLYLLDEASFRLDPISRRGLIDLLTGPDMARQGLVMTGHDIDFAAQVANRAAILFDGEIIGDCPWEEFFIRQRSYSTDTQRVLGPRYPAAILPEQVRKRL